MRTTRIVGALVAVVLAVVMTSGALLAPSQARGLPKHQITFTTTKITNGKYLLKGKVDTFPSGKIKILKKSGHGQFRAFKKAKTDGSGKFRAVLTGKIGDCFQVSVPGTSQYKATKQTIGCIVRQA
jgi:hypothetical protein